MGAAPCRESWDDGLPIMPLGRNRTLMLIPLDKRYFRIVEGAGCAEPYSGWPDSDSVCTACGNHMSSHAPPPSQQQPSGGPPAAPTAQGFFNDTTEFDPSFEAQPNDLLKAFHFARLDDLVSTTYNNPDRDLTGIASFKERPDWRSLYLRFVHQTQTLVYDTKNEMRMAYGVCRNCVRPLPCAVAVCFGKGVPSPTQPNNSTQQDAPMSAGPGMPPLHPRGGGGSYSARSGSAGSGATAGPNVTKASDRAESELQEALPTVVLPSRRRSPQEDASTFPAGCAYAAQGRPRDCPGNCCPANTCAGHCRGGHHEGVIVGYFGCRNASTPIPVKDGPEARQSLELTFGTFIVRFCGDGLLGPTCASALAVYDMQCREAGLPQGNYGNISWTTMKYNFKSLRAISGCIEACKLVLLAWNRYYDRKQLLTGGAGSSQSTTDDNSLNSYNNKTTCCVATTKQQATTTTTTQGGSQPPQQHPVLHPSGSSGSGGSSGLSFPPAPLCYVPFTRQGSNSTAAHINAMQPFSIHFDEPFVPPDGFEAHVPLLVKQRIVPGTANASTASLSLVHQFANASTSAESPLVAHPVVRGSAERSASHNEISRSSSAVFTSKQVAEWSAHDTATATAAAAQPTTANPTAAGQPNRNTAGGGGQVSSSSTTGGLQTEWSGHIAEWIAARVAHVIYQMACHGGMRELAEWVQYLTAPRAQAPRKPKPVYARDTGDVIFDVPDLLLMSIQSTGTADFKVSKPVTSPTKTTPTKSGAAAGGSSFSSQQPKIRTPLDLPSDLCKHIEALSRANQVITAIVTENERPLKLLRLEPITTAQELSSLAASRVSSTTDVSALANSFGAHSEVSTTTANTVAPGGHATAAAAAAAAASRGNDFVEKLMQSNGVAHRAVLVRKGAGPTTTASGSTGGGGGGTPKGGDRAATPPQGSPAAPPPPPPEEVYIVRRLFEIPVDPYRKSKARHAVYEVRRVAGPGADVDPLPDLDDACGVKIVANELPPKVFSGGATTTAPAAAASSSANTTATATPSLGAAAAPPGTGHFSSAYLPPAPAPVAPRSSAPTSTAQQQHVPAGYGGGVTPAQGYYGALPPQQQQSSYGVRGGGGGPTGATGTTGTTSMSGSRGGRGAGMVGTPAASSSGASASSAQWQPPYTPGPSYAGAAGGTGQYPHSAAGGAYPPPPPPSSAGLPPGGMYLPAPMLSSEAAMGGVNPSFTNTSLTSLGVQNSSLTYRSDSDDQPGTTPGGGPTQIVWQDGEQTFRWTRGGYVAEHIRFTAHEERKRMMMMQSSSTTAPPSAGPPQSQQQQQHPAGSYPPYGQYRQQQ